MMSDDDDDDDDSDSDDDDWTLVVRLKTPHVLCARVVRGKWKRRMSCVQVSLLSGVVGVCVLQV